VGEEMNDYLNFIMTGLFSCQVAYFSRERWCDG